MKNYVLTLFVALVATTGSLSTAAQTQKVYAVEKNGTLTFYYDDQRATREGTVYDMPAKGNDPEWITEKDGTTCRRITQVEFDASFAAYRPTSTNSWFRNCSNLQKINNFKNLNTSEVTDMCLMFYDCQGLQSLDLTSFNTANVTDMGAMFTRCNSLQSLDLSNFSTKNVTNMQNMFANCVALKSLDLTNFNTANVTDMGRMFLGCKALESINLTSCNTSNVTNMSYMFSDCEALKSLDLTNFNTVNVNNMGYMFSGCEALKSLDLTNFNTVNVIDMSHMFAFCDALKSLNLKSFNIENVTTTSGMFRYCYELTTIYNNWDWKDRRVAKSEEMFLDCKKLVGAVPYNANQIDITMANPKTGYFTAEQATSIADVATDDQASDSEVYDLSGRRVGNDYHGIVVKNRKKMVQP